MSDSNEHLSSIYEFSDDLGNALPPVPLPLGKYRATVRGVEDTRSKNSGNRMIKVTYHVSSDQYPPDYVDGDPEGETSDVYVVVKDDARGRFRFRKFIERHGLTAGRTFDSSELQGREVIVAVTHEEYEGESRHRMQPVETA